MKIMYVYDAIARIGGVERILVDKMNYLAEVYGHEVYLITSSQGLHPFSFPLSDKVKHVDINARFHLQYQYGYPKRVWVNWKLDRAFKVNLKKVAQEVDPDIMIGTTYYKADVICKLECRAKKIIESHCAKSYTGQKDGIERNWIIQLFCRYRLKRYYHTIERKSDALVALTHGDAKEWNKKEGISVIPNTTNQPSAKTSSCDTHRVISAGRLTYQKGYDQLIEAWKTVKQRHPDWKLDIYGTGTLQRELQKYICDKEVSDAVTIHPPTSTLADEFSRSAFYVMSSRFEGFGLVLIEAMLNGLPCISFDCPYGPADIIKQMEDGILVRNGDIPALADGICHLIENESARKEWGRQAKLDAIRYLPEKIMPQWNKLFTNTIKR